MSKKSKTTTASQPYPAVKPKNAAAGETRDCGGQPQTARDGGNTEDRESLGTGAPPSNTAPANYFTDSTTQDKPDFQLLRCAVDSLYLSYRGELASGWDQRLEGLTRAAQSTEEGQRSNAQVRIGEHLFEVRDKGKGRFAYVLVDNCFHIQLSTGNSSALPLAYVQVSSEMLTALSVTEAEERLRYIINTFGQVKGEAQISRADLFADFLSPVSMDSWAQNSWITRAAKIRGVAIFAERFFRASQQEKIGKNYATAYACGAPIRPRHLVPTQQGVET